MVAPLTQLLTKEHLDWTPQAQLAFDALKNDISAAPILLLSDFTLPFVVETEILILRTDVVQDVTTSRFRTCRLYMTV